jgi:polyribonucleotide nucleotidyltransferase
MQATRVERQIGGRTLSIETGTFAKLSDGSVTVQYGETVVFAAVVRANPRENIDFFPLQVDYRERRAVAGVAASAALSISDIPFTFSTAHARVGRINGELILFPTVEQLEYSDFDLVVAGTKNAVNMIEIGSRELKEDDAADAIEFGHRAVVEIVGAIEELQKKAGHAKPSLPIRRWLRTSSRRSARRFGM